MTAASLPAWVGLLLSGLAGRRMRAQPLPDATPDSRPILTDRHLLLPWASPRARDLVGASTAHAAAHLLHSRPHEATRSLKPMAVAVISGIEDARVERLAMATMPGLRRWWSPYHHQTPREDDLSVAGFMTRLGHVLFDPAQPSRSHWVDKGRALFERQAAADLCDLEAFRRIGSILANDLGQMRVRFEPQRHRVEPAYRDDNSFLWTHTERPEDQPPERQSLDATPEFATLTLREVQASPDADAPTQPRDVELGRYLVAEWDYRREMLKQEWCTVVETVPLASPHATGRLPELPAPLPRSAIARFDRSVRMRRQLQGEEIDLDAAVDVMIDRRLGLAPDGRAFKRAGREAPASSLLVLLDLSESANDRLADTPQTVLALEQQAALLLAHATTHRGHGRPTRLAIHGFNSNTRDHVLYQRLLDFGTPLDESAAGRVIAAHARHSTRMGAALRHATDMLVGQITTRRTLLVVTDGAPSDIDVFDPRYLTEDARAAVLEAQRSGVDVRCLTLDRAGEPTARRIFGWRNYRVVTNPQALALELRRAHAHAMAA